MDYSINKDQKQVFKGQNLLKILRIKRKFCNILSFVLRCANSGEFSARTALRKIR